MAGHSKWANIKHRKGKQDAKRGKIFTKHIRAITVAAKMGGGDIDANPRLRIAVDKALAANMTRDTINRAIKRGVGGDEGSDMLEIRYEGYGTQGVAIIVDCLTDNRNRTVADVRHAFTKFGGNLGTDGSVAYQFHKQGVVLIPAETLEQIAQRTEQPLNEEQLMELAIEYGASDINNNDDGSLEILSSDSEHPAVVDALQAANITPLQQEITLLPENYIHLDADHSEKLLRLIDTLEDLDDVQNVYSNAELDSSVLAD